MKFKNYSQWLAEDFAMVGAPPAGNVSGMGPVVPPGGEATGSGDAWPSLGAPSSLLPLSPKKKKRRKKKKKQLLENNWLDSEIDFQKKHLLDAFIELVATSVTGSSTRLNEWLMDFDALYISRTKDNLESYLREEELRDRFSEGKYTYINSYAKSPSSQWKIVYEDDWSEDRRYYFLERELTPEELLRVSSRIPQYLQENQLNSVEIAHLQKFIQPRYLERLRAEAKGQKFGI